MIMFLVSELWKLPILWQYCSIFSPYGETILLAYIITILSKLTIWWKYCHNIVHRIVSFGQHCWQYCYNIVTCILSQYCGPYCDQCHGEGWWCMIMFSVFVFIRPILLRPTCTRTLACNLVSLKKKESIFFSFSYEKSHFLNCWKWQFFLLSFIKNGFWQVEKVIFFSFSTLSILLLH